MTMTATKTTATSFDHDGHNHDGSHGCGRHGHGLWPSWFVVVIAVALMVMVCGRHGIGSMELDRSEVET